MRQARIVPSAIDAPPPNFVPQASGVGTPAKVASAPLPTDAQNAASETRHANGTNQEAVEPRRGLQEERVNRDAWRGVVGALQRLRDAQLRERELGSSSTVVNGTTNGVRTAISNDDLGIEAMDTTG